MTQRWLLENLKGYFTQKRPLYSNEQWQKEHDISTWDLTKYSLYLQKCHI